MMSGPGGPSPPGGSADQGGRGHLWILITIDACRVTSDAGAVREPPGAWGSLSSLAPSRLAAGREDARSRAPWPAGGVPGSRVSHVGFWALFFCDFISFSAFPMLLGRCLVVIHLFSLETLPSLAGVASVSAESGSLAMRGLVTSCR